MTSAASEPTKATMKYVRLGKSGLKVSKIILGCMSYGTSVWDWTLKEQEGLDQIKKAYALGINTFDTANMYSDGESEIILGKALKELGVPRSSYVVLTKVFFPMVSGLVDPVHAATVRANPQEYGIVNVSGLSRKHIFESIKASLERLQLDYVDVLQCHRFDPETPIEETMHALHDVVQAGYARYIGMSSCYAWQFHVMQNYAINNGLTPFISMQNYHALIYREEEREMLPVCKHFGVGTIPWSPLGRGLLARPRAKGDDTVRGKHDAWFRALNPETESTTQIIDRVEEIAKKKDISMAQVALAWIMTKEPVAAPIVGTTSMDHLLDMIKAVNVTLSEEEIAYLEEPYVPRTVVGH